MSAPAPQGNTDPFSDMDPDKSTPEQTNARYRLYCEVTSKPTMHNHCALIKTAPKSSILAVAELDRQFDCWFINRPSLEARMSEIIWKCWDTAVTAQSLSPNLLRMVWIDRVMNVETKLVV
ncbi:hypothetical protein FNAPI_8843 [Fusarium napiforme]|uniref:Uncharacterized protein n=1 Tax=Fusarium napiforme TaxID=42672 RepID=A0A8H5J0W0_9HYPO|nr:hypothetical protein FNAPI_8843 [Fusarium napiforme]